MAESERATAGPGPADAAERRSDHAPLPGSPQAKKVLALQRSIGNAQVVRLLQRKDELADLKKAEGYGKLSAAEKARLDALVGGTTSLSKRAPAELRKILDDAAVSKADPATFRKFLSDEKYLNYDVRLPGEKRMAGKKHSIAPETEVKDHPFKGGKADALMCEATIEIPFLFWSFDFKVPIFRGKTFTPPKPGRVHATPKDFAAILSELPVESLIQIKHVNLNPTANPDDAVWAADPNYNPGGGEFVSHMSMGASGIVQVYPSSANADLKEIETTLLHETGHSISNRILGGKKTDKPWDKWREAMTADGMNLSTYGKSSVNEDFAESWALWVPVRGTPAEAEVRALIPNRVKVMETIYSTGKPPP